MRPRAIQAIPGLDPDATPFARMTEFAKRIVAVPKSEVEKNKKQIRPDKKRKDRIKETENVNV